MTWEHMYAQFWPGDTECIPLSEQLKTASDAGWELVSTTLAKWSHDQDVMYLFFKRPVSEK
jgi:hypothetical protein